MKKLLAATAASATLLVYSVSGVMAQAQPKPAFTNPSAGEAGFAINDLGAIIRALMSGVMFIAALLVFAYMIWGGLQWITSGGDKGKTEEARNKITAAIIGLAVLAASYAIFLVILYFLGIANPLNGTNGLPIKSVLEEQGTAACSISNLAGCLPH